MKVNKESVEDYIRSDEIDEFHRIIKSEFEICDLDYTIITKDQYHDESGYTEQDKLARVVPSSDFTQWKAFNFLLRVLVTALIYYLAVLKIGRPLTRLKKFVLRQY